MLIGPFNFLDAQQIKQALETQNIEFEFFKDEDLEEQIMKQHNEHATISPRHAAGKLDLKILFFEINTKDVDKVGHLIEKFGFSLHQSDGSFELGEES